jgi:Transposase DDE domain
LLALGSARIAAASGAVVRYYDSGGETFSRWIVALRIPSGGDRFRARAGPSGVASHREFPSHTHTAWRVLQMAGGFPAPRTRVRTHTRGPLHGSRRRRASAAPAGSRTPARAGQSRPRARVTSAYDRLPRRDHLARCRCRRPDRKPGRVSRSSTALAIIPLRRNCGHRESSIPRKSDKWRRLYRGRSAVEREFGRLKHIYGLAFLRVRGIERVRLHADLVMLARLGQALSRTRVAAATTSG